MFLLSRRSAVFALFVILAFATSTLLAHIPKADVDQLLHCLDMSANDTSWPVESMRKAFYANDGVFTTPFCCGKMTSIAFSLRADKELFDRPRCVIKDLLSSITRKPEPGQEVVGRNPGGVLYVTPEVFFTVADRSIPGSFQYAFHNETINKESASEYNILTFRVNIVKVQETSFTPVDNRDAFLMFVLERGEEARLVKFKVAPW
eukprot:GHVS01098640.1.p1 GENE.GHVS01098640.1~~GHVS01098640.1.p1  ORF type:complete len:225 (-),score=8.73 GHVS01098640.1:302-916(-)